MSNIIEFQNISKFYPGVIANDNISFSIKQQSIHAILGENGAGKSTLVKILYGHSAQDSGQILINSKKIDIQNLKTVIFNNYIRCSGRFASGAYYAGSCVALRCASCVVASIREHACAGRNATLATQLLALRRANQISYLHELPWLPFCRRRPAIQRSCVHCATDAIL